MSMMRTIAGYFKNMVPFGKKRMVKPEHHKVPENSETVARRTKCSTRGAFGKSAYHREHK